MFILNDPRAKTETSILILKSLPGGKRFKYSTRVKIKPSQWNFQKEVPRNVKNSEEMGALAAYLEKIRSKFNELAYSLDREGKLEKNILKDELDIALGRKKREKITYFDFAEKFINESKTAISNETYKVLNRANNRLIDFVKHRGKSFDFEDIDQELYAEFVSYLKDIKDFSQNYIWTIIHNWRRILNEANRRKVWSGDAHKGFKAKKEKVYNVYLNLKELEIIHHHQFKKNYLDRAADRFLIGCFTGMRFGDYSRLVKANFSNDEFVIQDMRKEEGRVIIPIHWIVREIMEKYNGDLPGSISQQKMNNYLKEMGKEAGIDTEVTKTITKGGKKQTTTYKKHELISTHTARRSMATNMYMEGIPIGTIMQLTGHSEAEEFMKYIKVSEIEVAESLKNHPFFKKPKANQKNPEEE